MEEQLKTGTTTLGIKCKDGVVLAADRRATAGTLIVNKKAEKVQKINEYCALTMAGTVSDAQLLIKLIKAEIRLKAIKTERKPNVKEIANLLGNMIYSNIRKLSAIPGIAHFLLGGKDGGFHLYDLFPDGSVSEVDDFVASGSGSVMAYGLLEEMYKDGMSLKDGVKLAARAINSALQRDIASGNGIDIFTITEKGVEKVAEQKIKTEIQL